MLRLVSFQQQEKFRLLFLIRRPRQILLAIQIDDGFRQTHERRLDCTTFDLRGHISLEFHGSTELHKVLRFDDPVNICVHVHIWTQYSFRKPTREILSQVGDAILGRGGLLP